MAQTRTPEKAATLAMVKGNGTAVREAFARSKSPAKVIAAMAARALNDRTHPYIGKALVATWDLVLGQRFDGGVKDLLPAMAIAAVRARHEAKPDVNADAMIARLAPLVAKSPFEAGLINAYAAGLARQDGEFAQALDLSELAIGCRKLHPEHYVLALWIVQKDNSGLPIDARRAARFLAAALPHANKDARIHHNAACVYAELHDAGNVVKQIKALRAADYDQLATATKECRTLFPALARNRAFTTLAR